MRTALANFQTLPLKDAVCQLLARWDYRSDTFIAARQSCHPGIKQIFIA